VNPLVHAEVLAAVELLVAVVAGEVLPRVLEGVLLQRGLVLEGRGALRAHVHVPGVHLRNGEKMYSLGYETMKRKSRPL